MRICTAKLITITTGVAKLVNVASLPLESAPVPYPITDLEVQNPESENTNSLAIRDPGTVSLYERNEGTKVYTRALIAGTATNIAGCAVGAAIGGPAGCIAAIGVCSLGTVMTLAGVAAQVSAETAELARLKLPPTPPGGRVRRDFNDTKDGDDLVHYYPPTQNMSTVSQLEKCYNGSEVLVAHHDCEGPGCHEYYYSNAVAGNDTIHRISTKPRLAREKRANIPGSNFPIQYSDSYDNIYAQYSFWNIRPAMSSRDVKSPGFHGAMVDKFGNLPNLGLWCTNIHNIGIAGKDTQATAGVISFQPDNQYKWGDPLHGGAKVEYDENSAIASCQKE